MKKHTVLIHDAFVKEIFDLPQYVQDDIVDMIYRLEAFGSQLGRPLVDTLYGSTFRNMKELRFTSKGQVWRLAFAFDPKRQAILLVGGDKRGKNQKRFYKRLIKTADERYLDHLNTNEKKE